VNRRGFIVAVEPYLLRKGLVSVVDHMAGAVVVREFSAAEPFMRFLENYGDEYILISQAIFRDSSPAYLKRGLLLDQTILVGDAPPEKDAGNVQAFIHAGENKDMIFEKISALLNAPPGPPAEPAVPVLSQRERTIVRLASLGHTNRQIAEKLFLSSHTVTTHLRNISSKLGIRSLSGLTVYAIVNNIITIEEATSKPEQ
jgi:DNA-binding CsgD family transcriptional regulator